MEALESYLQSYGVVVSPALREAFQIFQPQRHDKGTIWIRENQIAKRVAFILKGKIRHFYNIDGKEYTRWVSLENNFVTAFSSFVSQRPSQENLECIEHCELLSTSREQFYAVKDKFPEIQQLWTLSLESEIVGYEDRVFQLITTDSEKRYLDFLEKYPKQALEIPQKYIASMLGIAPRHLSRIRNKLANRKK